MCCCTVLFIHKKTSISLTKYRTQTLITFLQVHTSPGPVLQRLQKASYIFKRGSQLRFIFFISNDWYNGILFSATETHQCSLKQTNFFLKYPKKYLKILTQNIRSINCNILDFQALLHRIDLDCDLLGLTDGCRAIVIFSFRPYKTTQHTEHPNT